MRLRFILWATLMLAPLGLATDAWAKKPQEFNAPREMSEEDLRQAKARSKDQLNGFGADVEQKPKDFPWIFVGMSAAALLIAAPFGLRAYKNMSAQLPDEKAQRPVPSRKPR